MKSLGIPAVILFGLPEKKDEVATGAWAEDGIVQKAARAIKREVPGLLLMGDVCLCEYMSHGHCGIVKSDPSKAREAMDSSANWSRRQGCDRSDAIAGRGHTRYRRDRQRMIRDPERSLAGVAGAHGGFTGEGGNGHHRAVRHDGWPRGAIRTALDEAGFQNIPILSYAAKFASGFYGPFREAADSAPHFGDRRSYQMDPANLREAMREIELDLDEGADMIMVKPAMPYLDVLHEARLRFDVPLSAYQVSGEYAMIKAAALNGWIDYDRVMMESLLCIQRAGASITLTYFAKEAARLLA